MREVLPNARGTLERAFHEGGEGTNSSGSLGPDAERGASSGGLLVPATASRRIIFAHTCDSVSQPCRMSPIASPFAVCVCVCVCVCHISRELLSSSCLAVAKRIDGCGCGTQPRQPAACP